MRMFQIFLIILKIFGATEKKKLEEGFYINPTRARSKEINGQGFYMNSKKKKLKLPIESLSNIELKKNMQKI